MDVQRRIAVNVKRARKERGLSQEELADRAGVHRTYVSQIERGVKNATFVSLDKIAQALGTPLAELVG
jgi:transcriptional regulator with XRE-family HTH domain